MIDKVDAHREIVLELNNTYERKNADYGDSFSNARKDIPYYTLGKLYDKFSRYKNIVLSGSDPKVNESIEDTLLDMANYCIMEVLERRAENVTDKAPSDGEKYYRALTEAFGGK